MKTFKKFLKQMVQVPIIPYMEHGKHAQPSEEYPIIPAVNHGKHSVKENFHPETKDALEWGSENDNHHIGDTLQKVHEKTHIRLKDYSALPEEHLGALAGYTYNSSSLNRHLIKSALNTSDPLKEPMHNEQITHLDSVLKNHKLEHDLHVYHGTHKFNPDELARLHPDRKIRSAAYMSTSIDKKTAAGFSRTNLHNTPQQVSDNMEEGRPKAHILHLHLKAGQRGMYMGAYGDCGNEHEFILPRDSTIKVHHEPTILHNGIHVWHGHIDNDEDY